MVRLFALVLLVGCSGADGAGLFPEDPDLPKSVSELRCGWVRQHTKALEPLPEGRCWLMIPEDPNARATTLAEAEACDVQQGFREYPPGTWISEWQKVGPLPATDLWRKDVPCSR